MKLLRYGQRGSEKPGILDKNGEVRDLSREIDDVAGNNLTVEGLRKIAAIDIESLPAVAEPGRLGPCIARTGKLSLQPGDIISTGTPPGVSLGMKPPIYLRAGQTIKLGIEGLGEQTQFTVDAA
jgi:ureidoglycolate lyase